MITYLRSLFIPAAALIALFPCSGTAAALEVFPPQVTLSGRDARQQLIVINPTDDLTRAATYRSDTPHIVAVSPAGIATPVRDGVGQITITHNGQSQTVKVTVQRSGQYRDVTFERDVQAILTRHNCNAGACHGKARGQNGFMLSLLGYDHGFDYAAIVEEARGRRVFASNPDYSLLLRKASGTVAHGGGRRLAPGHAQYAQLVRWIEAGCPRTPADAPRLERVTVYPTERILAPSTPQQLVVTAHYSDGTTEDVTHLAAFSSSESIYVSVDENGLAKTGPLPGEAAIMARFQHQFALCHVLVPMPGSVPDAEYAKLPRKNFIDEHVWAKLKRLGVTASEPATDHAFLRRAYLDVIGRLPSVEEARAFLDNRDPQKRDKLIDALLARPEYADFWANKWADLIRPNPYRAGIKAVYNLDAWLRESFRENKPYDRFAYELITATGSTFRDGPTVMHRDRREPEEITTMVSQLFLGVRLDCAKCHHHPFEIWSQDDFYSFAAFFDRVGHRGQGISAPISGGEEIIFLSQNRLRGGVKHPVSGKTMEPKPLLGQEQSVTIDQDPRRVLAEWMIAPNNPFFAKVMANRVWADLMGRGIVDPVDDLRATNPPSNGPLLDALAADFQKNKYDIKKLIRAICTSHVYGLSSIPNDRNLNDGRNYSRHYRQRLRAEIMLDAVSDVTGVPEPFAAMPPSSRSMELWTVRSQSVFLDSFGRPDPNQDPPCERTTDTTVVQALHLMNSPRLHGKVIDNAGRAAKLAESKKSNAEIVEELYLAAYSRRPKPDETAVCLRWFDRPNTTRRQAIEDLLWAFVNTPEFVFKD
ncbi:MAG: DUF1553 domain-containing protein [Bacteroidales bacterium]|nr:DUF1553 domain-containing protein [Bacteroidales bacterium]